MKTSAPCCAQRVFIPLSSTSGDRQPNRHWTRGQQQKAEAGANRRIKELEKELARKEKALPETAARLVLRKKAAALWGEEDDDTESTSDEQILAAIEEAMKSSDLSLEGACEELGVCARTVQRWRKHPHGADGRCGPRTKPRNALSGAERKKVIRVANSPEFRDRSPKEIVPMLADRGEYIASEATFYRVLRAEGADSMHRALPKCYLRPTGHATTPCL